MQVDQRYHDEQLSRIATNNLPPSVNGQGQPKLQRRASPSTPSPWRIISRSESMGMGMGMTVVYGISAPLESVQWPHPGASYQEVRVEGAASFVLWPEKAMKRIQIENSLFIIVSKLYSQCSGTANKKYWMFLSFLLHQETICAIRSSKSNLCSNLTPLLSNFDQHR